MPSEFRPSPTAHGHLAICGQNGTRNRSQRATAPLGKRTALETYWGKGFLSSDLAFGTSAGLLAVVITADYVDEGPQRAAELHDGVSHSIDRQAKEKKD
jgi:hypothetical protein